MILQKPLVNNSLVVRNSEKPYQASYFPSNTMSGELQEAYKRNIIFKKLMLAPDKII
jgi:hypothetical protein